MISNRGKIEPQHMLALRLQCDHSERRVEVPDRGRDLKRPIERREQRRLACCQRIDPRRTRQRPGSG